MSDLFKFKDKKGNQLTEIEFIAYRIKEQERTIKRYKKQINKLENFMLLAEFKQCSTEEQRKITQQLRVYKLHEEQSSETLKTMLAYQARKIDN